MLLLTIISIHKANKQHFFYLPDKLVVGSLNGVLRIFIPQADGFKAEHLMLEMQMNSPILQISAGKFVP